MTLYDPVPTRWRECRFEKGIKYLQSDSGRTYKNSKPDLSLVQYPLPEYILTLGVEEVKQIWRDAKLKVVGIKRAKTLVSAAEHSVGCMEGATTARTELRILLDDYATRSAQLQDVMTLIEELLKQILMAEKLLEIKGVGIKTVGRSR